MDITDNFDQAPTRLATVLTADNGQAVLQDLNGKKYTVSLETIDNKVLHGDTVALGGDGRLRAYVRGADGSLPREALDTQIFSDVAKRGGIAGMRAPSGQSWDEQLRINKRNELAAHYQGQAATRALELVAAGVLQRGMGGGLAMTENWREAYIGERKLAGRSEREEVLGFAKLEGVVKEIGALNAKGQRGIVLESVAGQAFVPTTETKFGQGSVIQVERDAAGKWGVETLGEQAANRVRESLERQLKAEREHKRTKSRSRSDRNRDDDRGR